MVFIHQAQLPKQPKIFIKFGFQNIGTKKDWTLVNGTYKDEVVFQLINTKF